MKTAKILMFSLAVIFLSCNEDEDPMPTKAGMVGQWVITALEYRGTTTATVDSVTTKTEFTGTAKDMDLITDFEENPNTVTSEGRYTIVLKSTRKGQTTVYEYEMNETVTNGTWTLNGKTLTVTNDLGAQTATILNQTSSTLTLKVEVSQDASAYGVAVSNTFQAIYTFTKQ